MLKLWAPNEVQTMVTEKKLVFNNLRARRIKIKDARNNANKQARRSKECGKWCWLY